MRESSRTIDCFGGRVEIRASGTAASGALMAAAARLLNIHVQLTRFSQRSELSRLNVDPRTEVPASSLLRTLARAVHAAGERSGGLVDATTIDALEFAGYRESLRSAAPPATVAPEAERRPATPDPRERWRLVSVDDQAGTIIRPPGVRIDSGGLAKGLAADLVGATLATRPTWSVDCGGDLRIGGSAGVPRPVFVKDPVGGEPVYELSVTDGAVATSGVTRRSWLGPGGSPAHHLIDPGSGLPAWTGIVQVTAMAPTALGAEIAAKGALLAGPDDAAAHLPYGGVLVLDDSSIVAVEPVPGLVAA